jgi:hypothetical protein
MIPFSLVRLVDFRVRHLVGFYDLRIAFGVELQGEKKIQLRAASNPEGRIVEDGGTIRGWRNNIGQRNVAPVAGGGGVTGLMASFGPRRFWANNPYGFEGRVKLEVILPDWLIRRGWGAAFVNPGGASFTLTGRGSREVLLRLKPGSDFSPSDVPPAGMSARIVVRLLVNGIPVGGMSYAIDPNLKTPAPELPGKGDRRHCTDEAKDLLECLCVPVDDVKSVRIKRVTLDIDLKTDCD